MRGPRHPAFVGDGMSGEIPPHFVSTSLLRKIVGCDFPMLDLVKLEGARRVAVARVIVNRSLSLPGQCLESVYRTARIGEAF